MTISHWELLREPNVRPTIPSGTRGTLRTPAMGSGARRKNQQLAKIGTLQELRKREGEFTEKEVKSYKTHPAVAAEIAKGIDEVPPDVDTIIMQHHERPDGKGFPERYRRDGYSCEIRVGNVIYTGAENIALSHLYNSMIKEDGISYYN